MRLDLFMKTSRLVKRRAVARELCDTGRVIVNGHEAKPGRDVKYGDVVTLRFSSRILEVEVLLSSEAAKKKPLAEELYRVKSDRRLSKEEAVWSENL